MPQDYNDNRHQPHTVTLARPDSSPVVLYALNQGWKSQPVKNPSLMVFVHPRYQTRQLQVPKSGSERDIEILMGEVVRKLSEIEKRPAEEVSYDIRHPYEDILRLRVQSKKAESGTLPLPEGLKLFQGSRELLIAAACFAHQPQSFYLRKGFKRVEEFIERCQMGQTGVGSYIATVLTPPMAPAPKTLFDDDQFEEDYDNAPFERKVTLSLMRGLHVLETAVQTGDSEIIEQGMTKGVSADLCDAVAGFSSGDDQSYLQVAINWSPVRPRVPDAINRSVRFAAPDLAFIGEAGKKLREKVSRPEDVQGPIISLAENTMLDGTRGFVTIKAEVAGKAARLRFGLKDDEYMLACNAHRDKKRVRVTGILYREETSKMFELRDIKDFKVISSE